MGLANGFGPNLWHFEIHQVRGDEDTCLDGRSGGDNLSATFSPELSDLTLYVIDVSAGDKIPRKGGPGITRSDLLIINKTDLAPLVGASLEVMDRDAKKMRGERPFVFSNLKAGDGLQAIICLLYTSPSPRDRG